MVVCMYGGILSLKTTPEVRVLKTPENKEVKANAKFQKFLAAKTVKELLKEKKARYVTFKLHVFGDPRKSIIFSSLDIETCIHIAVFIQTHYNPLPQPYG